MDKKVIRGSMIQSILAVPENRMNYHSLLKLEDVELLEKVSPLLRKGYKDLLQKEQTNQKNLTHNE